jgi:MFS family permease
VGPPTPDPTATAALDPRRWRALPVLLVGSFLASLNVFIVHIALPAMRGDLGARSTELQFVVAGYGIGYSVFLITGGRLGDLFGRKRVFLLGLTGFTLASALCGLATTPTLLIAARVLQALTAATLVPQVLAIIRVEFSAAERPLAIGLYGTSMGVASIVAQLLGGLLITLDLFGWSWRWIFLVNIPCGLVAVVVAARMLRESRPPTRPTLDLMGVGLVSLGLCLLLYPLVEGREAGWPAWSWAMLVATLPVLGGFVGYERHVVRRGRSPLVALHLFQVATVTLGLVVSVAFFGDLLRGAGGRAVLESRPAGRHLPAGLAAAAGGRPQAAAQKRDAGRAHSTSTMPYDHAFEGKGVRAVVFKAGQGDAAQVDGLVKAVGQRFGRLDILGNTAGVFVTGSDEGKGTKDEEASK